MSIRLTLLGAFAIESREGKALGGKLSRKSRAILAFLAASGQPHTRQLLYEWFCQDSKDPAGTLRWHLSQIRRKVSAELLVVDRQTAVINPALIQCDHHQFQAAMDNLADCDTERLARAVGLYQGPFLADLSLKNAPEFEVWLVGERSRLQRLYEKGAAELVRRYIRQGQFDLAIPITQRLLQSNPLLEMAHTYLVWLYAKTRQRGAALRQIEQCRTLLWEELAVEPSAELETLYEAISNGQPLPPILAETQPTPETAAVEPTQFIGRTEELEQLQALWQNGRAVALVDGSAGSGKTRLALEFGRRLPPAAAQLVGRCYETTSALPYHPWQAILEQQLRQLDGAALKRLTPYWRKQLGLLLPDLAQETAVAPNQNQLFRAVAYLLLELDGRPTLLVLDDLQWADEASLQLYPTRA